MGDAYYVVSYYYNYMYIRPYCFGQVWYTLNEPEYAMKFLSMTIEEILLNNNTSSASCNPALYEQILRDLSNVYQVTKELTLSEDVVRYIVGVFGIVV